MRIQTNAGCISGLILVAMLTIQGCGRKQAPAPETPSSPVSDKTPSALEHIVNGSQAAAPAPPPTPAPNAENTGAPLAVGTDQPAAAETGQETILRELTAGLQVWLQVKDGYPKDLKQLADAKFIPRVPTAPPGKNYAFDRAHHQVILVDK